jgi:hypothetical protein
MYRLSYVDMYRSNGTLGLFLGIKGPEREANISTAI